MKDSDDDITGRTEISILEESFSLSDNPPNALNDRDTVDFLRRENAELRSRNSELERLCQGIKVEYDRLSRSVEETMEGLYAVDSRIDTFINSLRQELDDQRKQLDLETSKRTIAEKHVKELENELELQRRLVQGYADRLDEQEHQFSELEEERNDLDLNRQLKQRDHYIEGIYKELMEHREALGLDHPAEIGDSKDQSCYLLLVRTSKEAEQLCKSLREDILRRDRQHESETRIYELQIADILKEDQRKDKIIRNLTEKLATTRQELVDYRRTSVDLNTFRDLQSKCSDLSHSNQRYAAQVKNMATVFGLNKTKHKQEMERLESSMIEQIDALNEQLRTGQTRNKALSLEVENLSFMLQEARKN